jgi:uncharacterized protein YceH (UPF0502 family)
MHIAELTPPEQRVLGCLIEKRWTTPDQYPLSLNGLRLACNQSTNRDPVTTYDEATVRDAAQRLCLYGLARLASGHGSRAVKYRHLAEEALGLDREELAVLAVLLLRGPQTPGELKARTERLAPLASLDDVERVLSELVERDYVRRIGRRPGQKEDRFEHLLGPKGEAGVLEPAPASAYVSASPMSAGPTSASPGSASPMSAGPMSASPGSASPMSAGPMSASPGSASPTAASTVSGPPISAPAAQTTPEFAPAQAPSPQPVGSDGSRADDVLTERVAALEAEVASLRADLDELRDLLTEPATH